METGNEDLYFESSSLSEAMFISIKNKRHSISGTESDESANRSVKFSKLAEVREMSPYEATDAFISRLPYNASLRVNQRSHHRIARTALMFCILWFIANYTLQLALDPSDTATITVMSSSSTLFTICLAAIFPSSFGDKFTCSKLICVIICLSGIVSNLLLVNM